MKESDITNHYGRYHRNNTHTIRKILISKLLFVSAGKSLHLATCPVISDDVITGMEGELRVTDFTNFRR